MRYNHIDMLPELAFQPIGKRMTFEGGGKSKSPKIPDMTKAAEATAEGNIEAARIAAKANRVSQYTPYGDLVYTQEDTPSFDQGGYDKAYAAYQKNLDAYNNQYTSANSSVNNGGMFLNKNNSRKPSMPMPVAPSRDQFMSKVDPDKWRATQTLSPTEQAKLDKNSKLELGLLDTAQLGLEGVNENLKKGFNFDILPKAAVNAGETAQDAIMRRLNPQFGQDEESLRTRLVNQGVRAGSQAWDNEFRNFNNRRNDAYSQAALQGIDVGQRARQQALEEQEFGRTEGLNIVNALRTGNQVNQPNFVNTPQQATTAGADILGAQQGMYQAQVGANNAQNANSAGLFGGLMQAGGTAASAYFL